MLFRSMALQVLAESNMSAFTETYPIEIIEQSGISRITWKLMWLDLLRDLQDDISHAEIAAKFHQTVIDAVVQQAQKLANKVRCKQVVLSGGVFQNKLLLEGVQQRLQTQGFDVLIPQDYPLNDGGLSLGQAIIAAAEVDRK